MKNILKPFILVLVSVFMVNCSNNESELSNIENKVLQLIEESNLENNALFIYEINNNDIIHEIKDGFEVGWSETETVAKSSSKELCRGGGVSFAKCVKNAVDSGSCVLIYKDGGDYVAVKTTCPFTH